MYIYIFCRQQVLRYKYGSVTSRSFRPADQLTNQQTASVSFTYHFSILLSDIFFLFFLSLCIVCVYWCLKANVGFILCLQYSSVGVYRNVCPSLRS